MAGGHASLESAGADVADGEPATFHFMLDHQTIAVMAKGSEVSFTYHQDP